jgi:hypothetical protein
MPVIRGEKKERSSSEPERLKVLAPSPSLVMKEPGLYFQLRVKHTIQEVLHRNQKCPR